MSARNPESIPASLSPINRESELRTDAAKLAQLWNTAQIIHLVDGRLSATDESLTFIDAAAVAALGDVFVQWNGAVGVGAADDVLAGVDEPLHRGHRKRHIGVDKQKVGDVGFV